MQFRKFSKLDAVSYVGSFCRHFREDLQSWLELRFISVWPHTWTSPVTWNFKLGQTKRFDNTKNSVATIQRKRFHLFSDKKQSPVKSHINHNIDKKAANFFSTCQISQKKNIFLHLKTQIYRKKGALALRHRPQNDPARVLAPIRVAPPWPESALLRCVRVARERGARGARSRGAGPLAMFVALISGPSIPF